MEIERRLSAFPVPELEQNLWQLDQIINAYGINLDKDLISGALAVDEIVMKELSAEAIQITGVDNPKSVKQLTEWLNEEIDEEVTDLTKDTVKDLLGKELDNDKAKRVLEIRQELSKASVKKYTAMDTCICEDGRARGLLQFYGANRTVAGRVD